MRNYVFMPDQRGGFDKEKMDNAIMVSEELKFHIASPEHVKRGEQGFEEDEALRANAWEIVSAIIFSPDADIHAFKLRHPEKRFSDIKPSQFGKDITVYARPSDNKTPEEWGL